MLHLLDRDMDHPLSPAAPAPSRPIGDGGTGIDRTHVGFIRPTRPIASCVVETPSRCSVATAAASARGTPVTTTGFMRATPALPGTASGRLAVGHALAGIAPALHAAVERHAGVIFPEVLLRRQHLEGLALLLHTSSILRITVGFEVALLRWCGSNRKTAAPHRRGSDRACGHRLRDDPRLWAKRVASDDRRCRGPRGCASHEARIELVEDVDGPVEHPVGRAQG